VGFKARGGSTGGGGDGTERRKHARVAREVGVKLETEDGGEFDARSIDVSDGGMFVSGDFFIPACTIVHVKPDGDGVPATTATVVRARDRGGDFAMGLWFDDPDNDNATTGDKRKK
jgi:hypothetical protein